ncbi:hypothetical protein PHET_05925 [Paragonimus heterotremus]|uniref:Uncharacterized protein n=1 Tax=Paragonimus heterotremus TaxID=100268 RepID=A0A8J4SXK7_9TREM|nr:hypothetical protein PHET_05925 [Paragonimus heterotremus]
MHQFETSPPSSSPSPSSSSSRSPTVQPASISKVQGRNRSGIPYPLQVNLRNITTIGPTNTSDNVVISTAREATRRRDTPSPDRVVRRLESDGIAVEKRCRRETTEVVLTREGVEATDELLLPAAIRTWMKGSRGKGAARRRTRKCSEDPMVRYLL